MPTNDENASTWNLQQLFVWIKKTKTRVYVCMHLYVAIKFIYTTSNKTLS